MPLLMNVQKARRRHVRRTRGRHVRTSRASHVWTFRAGRGPAHARVRAVRKTLAVQRRLLRRLAPHRWGVMAGVALTIVSTGLGIAQPWPVKILVDDVLGPHHLFGFSHRGALVVTVVLTVSIFMLSGLVGLVQSMLLHGLGQHLIQDLRAELFGHMTRLSLRFHDTRDTGDTLYRVTTDSWSVQSVLLDGFVPFTAAVLTLVGTLVVMATLDLELAALAVVAVPAAAILSKRYTQRIRRQSTTLHEREAAVYSHAEGTLTSMRTVQAFGREGYELERFRRRVDDSRAAMMRLITNQTIFGLLVDAVLAVGLAAVTGVAALAALDGHLSAGEVLVFVAYAGQLYGPVSSLGSVVSELQSAAAGAARVFEVLDQPQLPDPRPPSKLPGRAVGLVHFRDVWFAYEPGHPVVRGATLQAEPGQLVALVGPTGAGKTTLMSLLLRLYDANSGSVSIDGYDVKGVPLAWLREQIALVPQEPLLFPASVRENIRYGRLGASDAEVEEAARMASVLEELETDPRGLDTPIGDAGVMLSVGQRQRVSLARAFLKGAPVLVLDEPTAALDALTEAAVVHALGRFGAERTCFVIAHRLVTARRADQILVVDAGRIVQRGTHAELVSCDGPYRNLHRARFGHLQPAIVEPDGVEATQAGDALQAIESADAAAQRVLPLSTGTLSGGSSGISTSVNGNGVNGRRTGHSSKGASSDEAAARQSVITVLTATAGCRPTMLAEAVASVRDQSFTAWEHVIVDDGSNSVSAIDGARVLRVSHRGPGAARNAGLAATRGRAVALLDDDDLWHPDHLKTLWSAMESTDADVVYADCDEVGRRDGYATVVRDFDAELLERENFICLPATLVRTEALRAVGGFATGPLEDWKTWKKMAAAGCRFVHVPKVTVVYRFHTDNLTYGGADPERTRAARMLEEAADKGRLSWERYAEKVAEVWS